MLNFNWLQVSRGVHRCEIDGDTWEIEVECRDSFRITGPGWFRSRVRSSFGAAEAEIRSQIVERREALEESRGQEYQAWCRGYERV
jgi:hypothetical protein